MASSRRGANTPPFSSRGGGIIQADSAIVKVNIDQVILSGDSLQDFGDHSLKLVPFFQGRPGDSLVGVDVRQLPTGVLCDEVGVVADLGAVGVELVFRVGGHPAVCRHLF